MQRKGTTKQRKTERAGCAPPQPQLHINDGMVNSFVPVNAGAAARTSTAASLGLLGTSPNIWASPSVAGAGAAASSSVRGSLAWSPSTPTAAGAHRCTAAMQPRAKQAIRQPTSISCSSCAAATPGDPFLASGNFKSSRFGGGGGHDGQAAEHPWWAASGTLRRSMAPSTRHGTMRRQQSVMHRSRHHVSRGRRRHGARVQPLASKQQQGGDKFRTVSTLAASAAQPLRPVSRKSSTAVGLGQSEPVGSVTSMFVCAPACVCTSTLQPDQHAGPAWYCADHPVCLPVWSCLSLTCSRSSTRW